MKTTLNFNLKLPDGTDIVNINDLNENTTKIDTEVASIKSSVSGLANGLVKAKSAEQADNAAKVNGFTVQTAVPENAKFTDTVYTHPITAGNKHIPSGGSTGQILQYGGSSGTAKWVSPDASSMWKLLKTQNVTLNSEKYTDPFSVYVPVDLSKYMFVLIRFVSSTLTTKRGGYDKKVGVLTYYYDGGITWNSDPGAFDGIFLLVANENSGDIKNVDTCVLGGYRSGAVDELDSFFSIQSSSFSKSCIAYSNGFYIISLGVVGTGTVYVYGTLNKPF